MKYDEFGRELPDDTAVEAPIKFRRPPTIQELIAMHVRSAMQVERAMGKEGDEEDFEEEQEIDDVLTPYELHAYAGEADVEFRRAKLAKDLVDRLEKKKDNKSAVNSDRIKDDDNVQQRRVDSDRASVGDAGEERAASGGKGRSTSSGSGGVSEGGA